MAYRTTISNRDRSGAIAAVVAVHLALLYMLLHLSGKADLPGTDSVMRVFNLEQQPPPPPPPPPPQQQKAKPKEKEGGSSPPNIRSQATPVQAPKPKLVIPPVPVPAMSDAP